MTRTQITQRALRSAATVTITMLLGCSASVEIDPAHESGTATAEAPTEAPQAARRARRRRGPRRRGRANRAQLALLDGRRRPRRVAGLRRLLRGDEMEPQVRLPGLGPSMPPSMELA